MKSHKCQLRQDSISHLPKNFPDSNWYTRLERRLAKLFLVSKNHPEVFHYLKSNAAIGKESKRQVQLDSGFIIHPLCQFRKIWNILICMVMFLHQLLTAWAIGFFVDMEKTTIKTLVYLDIIMCSILLIEILLTFRTGYIVRENNEIILNSTIIAKKYMKHLIPDLISCLPFTYLATKLINEESGTVSGSVVVFMCCLFAFSFYRLTRISFYFSSVPILLKLSEKGTIIFTLCLRSIYCWHWASCIRRIIPLYVDMDPNSRNFWEEEELLPSKFDYRRVQVLDEIEFESVENLLLQDLEETVGNYTMTNKYTRTMMITLKLVLQSGYGSETSDSIYNMLMTTLLMLGGWIYATHVLILISNVIMASVNAENNFVEMSREVDAFCDRKGLSLALTKKIQAFYMYKYRKHYFDEDAIKESTPANLRKEIMMHTCSSLISKVPLFKDVPQLLLENIVECLKLEIYFPDDVIIHADTAGEAMYFIAFGTAGIYATTGRRLATLSDGSHFGETSLLIKGQNRIASVMALEICEIYKLNQKDFRRVIGPHADFLHRMEQTALELRNKIVHWNEENK